MNLVSQTLSRRGALRVHQSCLDKSEAPGSAPAVTQHPRRRTTRVDHAASLATPLSGLRRGRPLRAGVLTAILSAILAATACMPGAALAADSSPRFARDAAVSALNGIVVPLITPVKEDDSFDQEAMHALVDYLIGAGVHALFPCGETGRQELFTLEEKRAVITAVLRHTAGRVPVFAGVDGETLEETVSQAQWASAAGVDAVIVMPPAEPRGLWMVRDTSLQHERLAPWQKQVEEFIGRIHDAVDVYVIVHDRTRSGMGIFPETYARLAELPRVIGMKKSTADLSGFPVIRRATGEHFAVCIGNEYVYLGALAMGGTGGVIGGGANVYPQVLLRLREAFLAGNMDKALELQARLNEAARHMRRVKDSRCHALRDLGVPICNDGRPDPRHLEPRDEASPEDVQALQDFVRKLIEDVQGQPAAAAASRADENTPAAQGNRGANVMPSGQNLAGRVPPNQT